MCIRDRIKAVTPVAEEEGIRLGIHPDDPPVDNLGGVPRIMTSFDAFKRLIEIYPSDSNAIEFCQGTFSEMDEDIYEIIEYFASRNKILFVHFRNVSAPNPNEFNEEFINTGYVDMVKAIKIYKDAGYEAALWMIIVQIYTTTRNFLETLVDTDLEYSLKATYKDYWIH